MAFHGVIPCTAWCRYQKLNEKRWRGFDVKLAAMRARSRARVRQFVEVVRPLKRDSPELATGSFVWPRHCDGWGPEQCPEIKLVLSLMPHFAEPDGCMYGVRDAKTDELMHKPWRVVATDGRVCTHIRRRCDGGHVHAKNPGGKAVEASGNYTRAFSRGASFVGCFELT